MGAASSRDNSYKATFFRGWKPLPREIDIILMTLTPDLLKFHTSGAAGQKNGQFNRERNSEKANIEYRIMNIECRSDVFCLFKKKTERSDSILPHSTFRLPHSSNVVSYEREGGSRMSSGLIHSFLRKSSRIRGNSSTI